MHRLWQVLIKIPPQKKRVWCRSRDRCLNFNPFNIFGGMRCGRCGEAEDVRATMLRRIPSLFLNDAWIYSEDEVLWHGVAGMTSCFASLCLLLSCRSCAKVKLMYQISLGMIPSVLNTYPIPSVPKGNWCTKRNDCNKLTENDQKWS